MSDEPTPTIDSREGFAAALRWGFERAIAQGERDALSWLGLAYACVGLKDLAAATVAADAVLTQDSRNVRALLLKAELQGAQGDERGAAAFLRAALASASASEPHPPDLLQALERAELALQALSQRFETTLRREIEATPAAQAGLPPRFQHALDLLTGRRSLYLQQPRLFCFPELPHIQFFDRAMFPWLDAIEAATDDIRQELLAVLGQPQAFSPYVASDPTRPALNQGGMLDNPDWTAFFLWKNGERVAVNADRCPRTMAALAHAPIPHIPTRSPSILFSQLRPGARIPAHTGFVNTRLIVHLPLIVPPGCTFRVGNETRSWQEGRAWVFDDTIEHEAHNPADTTRVILLFEIWRPELSEAERALVCTLFEAIGRHEQGVAEWGI